ncbi:aspartate/glutamate racemase family protein [Streptomyces sp. NBC_01235]|uniref:aspartate/glutamate racemase family protein n=1 Tax=Streptomyces sp. NBC_01235 TaxID=2903788 RepID=UPI002E0E392C|nr:aspartate/glutamate racemase family protein [Streptomyces sp. NBC_01235]
MDVPDLETIKEWMGEYFHEHAGEFATALGLARAIRALRSSGRRAQGSRSERARGPRSVVLINANGSAAATETMTELARRTLRPEDGFFVHGVTAADGPRPSGASVDPRAAVPQVLAAALRARPDTTDAFVVSDFGDQAATELRAVLRVPVVGMGEAALLEASSARFGVAAGTPGLAESIAARIDALGLASRCTGIRVAGDGAEALVPDPGELRARWATAVTQCVDQDGARTVIVAGGEVAEGAGESLAVPLICPVAAACRRVRSLLG